MGVFSRFAEQALCAPAKGTPRHKVEIVQPRMRRLRKTASLAEPLHIRRLRRLNHLARFPFLQDLRPKVLRDLDSFELDFPCLSGLNLDPSCLESEAGQTS